MQDSEALLVRLESELRARFRDMRIEPSSSSTRLVVRLGEDDRSVVAMRIDDPGIPSFAVSYTRLQTTRKGDRKFSEVHVAGVLEAGLNWILRKVARHGYVPPESD
jgi:hypothetical protein